MAQGRNYPSSSKSSSTSDIYEDLAKSFILLPSPLNKETRSTVVPRKKSNPDDFTHIASSIMPADALPLSELIFCKKINAAPTEKKSAHSMEIAQRKNSTDPNETIIFKRTVPDEYEFNDPHIPDNPITELEAANALVAEWLITSRYVPETHAYYCAENNKFVGIGSTEIPFKANKEVPLRKEHLILDDIDNLMIEVSDAAIKKHREQLSTALHSLSGLYTRKPAQSYMGYAYQLFQQAYNCHVSSSPTAIQLKGQIDKFLKFTGTHSEDDYFKLLTAVNNRTDHIKDRCSLYVTSQTINKDTIAKLVPSQLAYVWDPSKNMLSYVDMAMSPPTIQTVPLQEEDLQAFKELIATHQLAENTSKVLSPEELSDITKTTAHETEASILERAILSAKYLHDHPPKMILNNEVLDILEELDEKLKGLVITTDNETQTRVYDVKDKKKYQITLRALKNYRTLMAAGAILSQKTLLREGDNHNRNFGVVASATSAPASIDYDHTDDPLTHHFTFSAPLLEAWLKIRKPTKETYKFSGRDFVNHPQCVDSTPFYSPTKKNIPDLAAKLLQPFFDVEKNSYSDEDIEVFKSAADNPIYDYSKSLTHFKFIMTDIKVYEKIHQLRLRKDWYVEGELYGKLTAFLGPVPPNNNVPEDSLLALKNSQQAERVQEVSDVLPGVPEFKDFLTYHGERAKKIIVKQMDDFKNKLVEKLPEVPTIHQFSYRELIDAIEINIKTFDEKYQAILKTTTETCEANRQAAYAKKLNSSHKSGLRASMSMGSN